jgi:uncharacterized protein (DUF1697 family)
MTKYVALLRGINVGGNKTIPMAKLKLLFESLGLASPKTHLNSGNVIFAAKARDRAKLGRQICDAIEAEFGFRPVVVLRSATDLKRIIAKNPFGEIAAHDPSHLLVMVLDGKPKAGAKAALGEAHSGPEETAIAGENVYVTYPNGIGRSKLTNALLEKHLGVAGTARNWNTVVKVVDLMEAMEVR